MRFVEELLPSARARLITIRRNAPLAEAADLLSISGRHMIVVCNEDGKMVGVVTRMDIVRQFRMSLARPDAASCAVAMTTNVVFCRSADTVLEVWKTMKERDLKNVPVVDPSRSPIGLLSAQDALELLMSEVEFEEQLIEDYIMGRGYQ